MTSRFGSLGHSNLTNRRRSRRKLTFSHHTSAPVVKPLSYQMNVPISPLFPRPTPSIDPLANFEPQFKGLGKGRDGRQYKLVLLQHRIPLRTKCENTFDSLHLLLDRKRRKGEFETIR